MLPMALGTFKKVMPKREKAQHDLIPQSISEGLIGLQTTVLATGNGGAGPTLLRTVLDILAVEAEEPPDG